MKIGSLFSALLFPLFLTGQISIDQSDMPDPGDTIRQSHTVNLGAYDFEETGDDHLWDFSGFNPFMQSVDTFVAINETPFIYQILFFFSANMAKPQFEFDQFEGFQITDSYQFFKNSSGSFKEVGIGITLNGLPLPTLYDEPDVIYKFPLSSGSIDSSMSSYDFDIPFLGYYGGWKKRINTVDGWGTIITPYGSFETIRLKSEILQLDSLYIDSLGFGFPIYREITEYKWLGKNMGLPICTMIDNGLIQSVTYIDSVRSLNYTGIETVNTDIPINVYPNPAVDRITLALDIPSGDSFQVRFLNISGELVFSEERDFHDKVTTFNLTPYNLLPGTYFIVLTNEESQYTKKVIIR